MIYSVQYYNVEQLWTKSPWGVSEGPNSNHQTECEHNQLWWELFSVAPKAPFKHCEETNHTINFDWYNVNTI